MGGMPAEWGGAEETIGRRMQEVPRGSSFAICAG